MAPEQLKEDYDKKVDIYALGVTYFELNCPFPAEGQRQHVRVVKHRNGETSVSSMLSTGSQEVALSTEATQLVFNKALPSGKKHDMLGAVPDNYTPF